MTNDSAKKYSYFFPEELPIGEETEKTERVYNQKVHPEREKIIKKTIKNNVWLSVSEAAKLGGIKTKTIRRAIKEKKDINYKIVNNKYKIDLRSLVMFMHTSKRLENKFNEFGLGQYVKQWRK